MLVCGKYNQNGREKYPLMYTMYVRMQIAEYYHKNQSMKEHKIQNKNALAIMDSLSDR